jgi:hypothetical protein
LFEEIRRRFKKPILKTMATFRVSIKNFQGINAIKRALQSGIEASK